NCERCVACRRGKPNCCSELKVMGVHVDGGMQPLLAVPARKLHRSTKLGFDQLALVETLGIGAHAIERAQLAADDFVLVIGAGPIGLSVLQFARLSGAKVAVVDVSAVRLELCRRIPGVENALVVGPDTVAQLRAINQGELPTCVIDATGNAKSMAGTFDLVAHGGRIVFVGLFQGQIAFDDPNFHRRELTVLASRNALPGTFRDIIRLIEDGRVDTQPWITHRFSLAETPAIFPKTISGNPAVLKAMIEV
ncbi:MAG TPA: zinc-binding dehydrogenase, partial [Candidatus Didemnitutus sp.]|nr:zinc-binding dehydrogenase [Candidatus Didemnitutus sp.]